MKFGLAIAYAIVVTTYFAIGFIGEIRSPESSRRDSKFSTALGVGCIWGFVFVLEYQEIQNSHPKKIRAAWREAWHEVF